MENTPETQRPDQSAPATEKKGLIHKKIDKLIKKGRAKAIVKELPGGRRVLVGFERLNKRSRFSRTKFFLPAPITLGGPSPEAEKASNEVKS